MKIHMVKSGDTMYTIAQKYGVKMDQLVAYNPQISNPDQIDVGMKVKIPSGTFQDGTTGVEYAHKHTVVQGDSLWKISKAWGLPLKALVDANPQLKNPSVLLTGEVVNIPKQNSPMNTMSNPSGLYPMNSANLPNYVNTLVTPNVSNIISPAAVTPNVLPQPPALPINKPVLPISQAPTPPPSKPVLPISQAPTPPPSKPVLPISQAPTPPPSKPELPISQPWIQSSNKEEANKEAMNIQPSENLFMQFNVPAVEASGIVKQEYTYQQPEMYKPTQEYQQPQAYQPEAYQPQAYQPQAYQPEAYQPQAYKPEAYQPQAYQPEAYQPEAYQPQAYKPEAYQPQAYQQPETYQQPLTYQQPQANKSQSYQSPTFTEGLPYEPYPAYASKTGCGCGCGDGTNIMPYYQNQPMYSSMPNYYMPQPMLEYSMQQPSPFQQNYPAQYQAPVSPVSPYGYMAPYPMGAYGDMNYYGMQTPYSPWINSSENPSPAQSLADSGKGPASNQQVSGVLGASDQQQDDTPVKKRTKNTQNAATRTSQKQDGVAALHHFLQKKSTNGESIRENKQNEPWMNR